MKKLTLLLIFLCSLTTVHAFNFAEQFSKAVDSVKNKASEITGIGSSEKKICRACGGTSYISSDECIEKSNKCGLGWIPGCLEPDKENSKCCVEGALGAKCRDVVTNMLSQPTKLKQKGVKAITWTDSSGKSRNSYVANSIHAKTTIVKCDQNGKICKSDNNKCTLCKKTYDLRDNPVVKPVDFKNENDTKNLVFSSADKAEAKADEYEQNAKKKCPAGKWNSSNDQCMETIARVDNEEEKRRDEEWLRKKNECLKPNVWTGSECKPVNTGSKKTNRKTASKPVLDIEEQNRIDEEWLRNKKECLAREPRHEWKGNKCKKIKKVAKATPPICTDEQIKDGMINEPAECFKPEVAQAPLEKNKKKLKQKKPIPTEECNTSATANANATPDGKYNAQSKCIANNNKNDNDEQNLKTDDPTLAGRKNTCDENNGQWFTYQVTTSFTSNGKTINTTTPSGLCCPNLKADDPANNNASIGVVRDDGTPLTQPITGDQISISTDGVYKIGDPIEDYLSENNCKCFKNNLNTPSYEISNNEGYTATCSDDKTALASEADHKSEGKLKYILAGKPIEYQPFNTKRIGTDTDFKRCQSYWPKGWLADQKRANHYNLQAEARWSPYWNELLKYTKAIANDVIDGKSPKDGDYTALKEHTDNPKTWGSCPKARVAIVNYREAKYAYLTAIKPNVKPSEALIMDFHKKTTTVKEKLKGCAKTLVDKMNECASIHLLTSFGTSSMAAQDRVTGQKGEHTLSEGNVKDTKSSMDNIIKCRTTGKETQDWHKCLSMISTYHGMSTLNKSVEVIHAAQVINSMANATTSIQNADAKERQVKQLEILKTQALASKRMAYERMASQSATSYMYSKAVSDMPSLGDALNYCNSLERDSKLGRTSYSLYVKELNKALQVNEEYNTATPREKNINVAINVQGTTENSEEDKSSGPRVSSSNPFPKNSSRFVDHNDIEGVTGVNESFHHCETYTNGDIPLLPNARAGDGLKAKAVQAGLAALKEYMAAEAFQNKANLLDRAVDRINNILNKDITTADELIANDLENMAICQADPTDPACVRIDTTRGVGFSGPGGFNLNGTSGNTIFSNINDSDENADKSNETLPDPNSVTPDGILANDHSGKSSIDTGDSAPTAAGIKMGGGSKGGGGGGGGGASAPGAPGGGGGGAPDSGRGSSSGVPGADRIGFSEGGVDSYSGGGGKRKRSRGNPFSKLFKKGRYGKNMKFGRNPASIGGKNGKSIFEKISNRYATVNSKKRLLEYEIQK